MFTLYTTRGCRNCQYAKLCLDDHGVRATVTQVDDKQRRDALKDIYGAKAFPIILKGADYIGGFSELVDYLNGQDQHQ